MEITIYRSIVSILNQITSLNNLKKININIIYNSHLEISLNFQGNLKKITESNSIIDSELLKVQKRIDLKGGILIPKETKNNLKILIKYNS